MEPNYEYWCKYYVENKEKIKARRRERFKNDPEYRKKVYRDHRRNLKKKRRKNRGKKEPFRRREVAEKIRQRESKKEIMRFLFPPSDNNVSGGSNN